MPLSKKRRNQLWYGYVIGMVVFYEMSLWLIGFNVAGFLTAFGSIAVLTIGFVIYMRRQSRPLGAPPSPAVSADREIAQ